MTVHFSHDNWKEVSEEELEQFLKTCNDYTRESNASFSSYKFRHNRHNFAAIMNRKFYIDKTLFTP